MKLVSYRLKNTESKYRIGCIEGNHVIDLQESYRQYLLAKGSFSDINNINQLLPSDPSLFFALGFEAINRAKDAYEFIKKESNPLSFIYERDQVVLGPPQPNPGKIICVGRNYVEHAHDMESDVPENPVLFA